MLPGNIKREQILQAIKKIDLEGIPKGAESDLYDAFYQGHKYPPKLLVSWANIFANGKELDRDSFEGGINTECFKILDREGFEIVSKHSGVSIFIEQLIKFLNQASLADLKTAKYLKQFRGLRVKVSFGQSTKSNVPWVALLREGEKVQEGIYPVYLYSIERKVLILAYGISETRPPKSQWNLEQPKETIKEYFKREYNSKPFRYGYSYVFKVYKLDNSPNFGLVYKNVISDLNELISQYKNSPLQHSFDSLDNSKITTGVMNKHPLNTILYGPPGTGKTFNTISHALAIIKGYDYNEIILNQISNPQAREQYKKEYDQLVLEGQISFVTFHQSYGYEEFVEGIKPKVNTDGEVEYNIEDGIFKKICILAGEKKLTQNFDSVYDQYITAIMDSGQEFELKTPTLSRPFVVKVNSRGNCVAVPRTEMATEMTITKKMLRNYIEHGIIQDWKPYLTAIASDIKKKYSIEFETINNTQKNFILIIDEINRGNISKIFGELITLIEDSKRIGSKEELRIKLSYSGSDTGELFGVPSNLYVIGTMNSTDRSIALMDTALRRRFTFVEYTARPELLNTDLEGIDLQRLLTIINDRLEFLLDKDHLLGHAYFLEVKSKNELCLLFRNKIIPLLEEYFYGDYSKIQLVLGDNKSYGKKDELKLVTNGISSEQRRLFGSELEGYEEKQLFRLSQSLQFNRLDDIGKEVFIAIYSPNT